MEKDKFERTNHVVLTSHKNQIFKESLPINWGEKDPKKRGPVIATISEKENRNFFPPVQVRSGRREASNARAGARRGGRGEPGCAHYRHG